KCLRDGASQGSSQMGGALGLDVLDLAQEPERSSLLSLGFEYLRVCKSDSFLLLRKSFRAHVPRDQMKLAPGLVQAVRALFQSLQHLLERRLRSSRVQWRTIRNLE